MNAIVPEKIFMTRGTGQHKEKLVSYEKALREAGINPFNLVRVSSIFPPACRLVSREDGLKELQPGQIVFLVMSENATDEPHRLISSSIGMAVPTDHKTYGYLAEHEGYGQTEEEAGRYTEELAEEMLATKLGLRADSFEFSSTPGPETVSTPRISVRKDSITQTAKGTQGLWTTTIAAAVLIT